ncbi:MAG TPA: choice-of-anchor D domain-containing protein [Terriglobales bacterium]|nr:choice-of-anchor D domain-containing protein [Terriglobales bacterium]
MNLPHFTSKSVFIALVGVLALAATCGLAQASPLASSPSTLQFGQVSVGSSQTISATLTNESSSTVTLQRVHSSRSNFTVRYPSLPVAITPGKSISIAVTFSPSASAYTTGTVFFNWGDAGTLGLNGLGVTSSSQSYSRRISASPSSLLFGNVQAGSTATLSLTLKNNGSNRTTIARASTSTGFAAQGLTLPLTLTGGQSYTFKIAFTPTTSGSKSGTFTALSSSGYTITSVPLSGTGSAQGSLSLSPSSVGFGNVNVGSTLTKSGTLTASGSSVTVTSAGSNSSEFVLSGITLPKTIAAGSSASYSVTFNPQSGGTASGAISFASNASDSTISESLTGTGVATTQPQSHSVNLTWNASTSKVAGYNIYRGSKSGGPYTKLNSALDTATNFDDGSVASSAIYYYVTTAVNSSGQESGYSNQVQVAIP